ncbi:MAG: diaminopimelate epimerase [candidate division Zixibacteria bacterium]|nr:diaminopimelate epimerase [candidate division Zixibacteria bacterium]
MPFVKMEGLGNCYIFVEARRVRKFNLRKLAKSLSDTTRGIGGDGLIVVETGAESFAMRIFNRDGSEAEMCGNGLRQAALFLKRTKIPTRKKFNIVTSAGQFPIEILSSKKEKAIVVATLGSPDFSARAVGLNMKMELAFNVQLLKSQKRKYYGDCVSMGNPHAIIWVDDFDFDWIKAGRNISCSRKFSDGVNVHFCRRLNSKRFEMKIFERGSGVTKACGSGAAACLASGVMRNLIAKKAIADMPGGKLHLAWDLDTNVINQEGPVSIICSGEYYN